MIDMPMPLQHQLIINNNNGKAKSTNVTEHSSKRFANLIVIDVFSDIHVDYDISNNVLGKGSTALVR